MPYHFEGDSSPESVMSTIEVSAGRILVSWIKFLVGVGLLAGLVAAAVIWLPQFSASKECRGGAFGSGFSAGFDVKRCELVVRRFGDPLLKTPLPQGW
jgi:hypothetical protein